MEVALVVLDGWGLAPDDGDGRDAVAAADTPTVDALRADGPAATLSTHGRRVGLPDGQMGNSEVGHQNLGAGRVVEQASTRITDAVREGRLAEVDPIETAFDAVTGSSGGRLHLLGLVGDGGVHARQDHLAALIEAAGDRGVPAVTHAFTDGRDTDPHDGAGHLDDLERTVAAAGTGDVATVVGRYYAMDRDENWERTRRAYDAVVDGAGEHAAESAVAAVEAAYDRGESDEFVTPTVVGDPPGIEAGDAVVVVNFRADRVRQIVRMLGDVDPDWPFETDPPETTLVTMTEYDESFPFPVAFPPVEPTATVGEVVADAGLTQLRVAESEKYPHVTYFFNGGREVAFDGENREIVSSPDVPTYDLEPEMSAGEVTDVAVDRIERDDPDLLVLNYANPDMVGHTGDFDAAVTAVETVDRELARLLDAVAAAGGGAVVTADHGNADDMGIPDDPHTAHTTSPVPIAYRPPPDDGTAERGLRDGGALCDVGPTLLDVIGIDPAAAMTGRSLLK